jgi:membrane associated rhomboid family serine protease
VRRPLITWALIAANVIVWVAVQGAGMAPALPASVCNFGLIAGELTGAVPPGTMVPIGEGLACVTEGTRPFLHVLTSMFMHGSWLHLIGNMWFLHLFGNNVEDSMGRRRFLAFYLISGIAAAAVQVVLDPRAAVPMVGASGAISGVMGGYLLLYPKVRVLTLVPLGFFITTFRLPAWTMLLYWFAIQLFGGLSALAVSQNGGVAFGAHVGGFVAGVVLVRLFARRDYIAQHRARMFVPSDYRRAA